MRPRRDVSGSRGTYCVNRSQTACWSTTDEPLGRKVWTAVGKEGDKGASEYGSRQRARQGLCIRTIRRNEASRPEVIGPPVGSDPIDDFRRWIQLIGGRVGCAAQRPSALADWHSLISIGTATPAGVLQASLWQSGVPLAESVAEIVSAPRDDASFLVPLWCLAP